MYRIAQITLGAVLFLVSAAHGASLDRIKYLEGAVATTGLTPTQLAVVARGYLPPGEIDVSMLAPPPAFDSAADKTDVALLKSANGGAGADRWQKALEDDRSLYDRLQSALGLRVDRKHAPRLVAVLNRAEEDVFAAIGEAKKRYSRPRPFQRFKLARVCGQPVPPQPEPSAKTGTSYPSGHAAAAWAAALIMMETAPMHASALVFRAVDYGQSRVVCGVHFPSDVEAGRILAAAIVDKLMAVAEFRRELNCAKLEVQAVLAGGRSDDLPACQ